MKPSSAASANRQPASGERFFKLADAAMRRAARLVAAENKRLGLPLIADKPKRANGTGTGTGTGHR